MTELIELLRSWQRFLKASGKAPKSISTYTSSVTSFTTWIETQDIKPTVDALTRPAVIDWLAAQQGVAASASVATRFRGLRLFSRWLVAEGELAPLFAHAVE